ncbi:MAG TPA: 30S ribosomal protein S4 [Anaerolinea thermolimosa]|uniref:Small ribosomal subunit protein uS4 n=1 Tax=Anaerolinea thermolimosa TaxID=229919 RepID=A0A3D1JJ34_9CHLR|nr:30S ribosomal protein S4 [Anaerolinea thermolimosa]GAP05802.1 SSU ribosomal protein S4P [Anaerolinea thermolimosa]HCE17636.1 30S ribosomal protein S4 [Anaerolinea thermolimosa]
MGRYIGPVCKLCRREGEKLFLKGERCYSPKCSFEKRGFAPGQHGRTRQGRAERESDYARQLRAKQRARRVYGIFERQFRRYFGVALQKKGLTGLNLLQTLEMRLDNVVYRLGYAANRSQARQLVNHGHILVNNHRADIPSMLLRPGDVVTVSENARRKTYWKELVDVADKRICPLWLDRDVKNLSGRVLRVPERAEIDGNLNEQLIVEYYSR